MNRGAPGAWEKTEVGQTQLSLEYGGGGLPLIAAEEGLVLGGGDNADTAPDELEGACLADVGCLEYGLD